LDPLHRNIRQFFKEEIGIPYGIEFQYGITPDDPPKNCATLHRLKNNITEEVIKTRHEFILQLNDKNSPSYRSFNCFDFKYNFNKPHIQRLLIPSEMGLGTSQGVARIFDLISNNRLFKEDTLSKALETTVQGKCSILFTDMILSKGGYMKSNLHNNFFFHSGWGGSIGFGDTGLGIGVAYATNTLDGSSEIDSRRERIIEALYNNIDNIEEQILHTVVNKSNM